MADIAQLGIAVDSTSAVTAATNLDALTASANNAATAQERLAGSASSAATAQSTVASAAVTSSSVATTAADRLIAALEKQIILFNANDAATAAYNGNLVKMTKAEFDHYQAQTAVLGQLQAESAQLAQFYAAQEAGVAAGQKFIASLTTQAETIGLTKTQLLEYKAAQLGVSEQAAPLIASIEAQTAALAEASTATVAMGESEAAAAARIQAAIAASLAQAAALNDNTVAAERYAVSVAEMAAAATKAESAQSGLAAASKAVASAQTEAAAQIEIADTTISAGAEKVVNALERQIIALTAGEAAVAKYDAQAAGLTQTEVDLVVAKTKELEATRAQVALGAEMAAAYEAQAVAATKSTVATSQFTREIATIFRELGEGRITYAIGSFTRLLSITNLLGLALNPITIGVGLLGFAAVKGSEQFQGFASAVASTGNSAGTSAGELQDMADKISSLGERSGVAAEALTKLTASGRFTADQILLIGTASTQFADATKTAVDKVVQEFVKLSEDPVKASVELNKQYHYLTLAVFEQIDALAKQGDAVGAADVAEKAYADALKGRADDVRSNLGFVGEAWKDVGDLASHAWDAMGDLGKSETVQQALDRVNKSLDAAKLNYTSFQVALTSTEAVPSPGGGNLAAIQEEQTRLLNQQGSERRARDLQASYQETQQAAIAGQQVLDNLQKRYDKNSELNDVLKQQKKAIDDIAAAGGQVQAGQGADLAAAITKKLTPKTPSTSALDNAAFQQQQSDIKNQYDVENKLNQDQAKILENDHKARLVSDQDFFAQQFALNDKDLQYKLSYYAQSKALLEADMKDSTTSAETKIKDQTLINKINSDALVALSDYATKDRAISDAQKETTNKKEDAVRTYTDALNKQYEAAQKAAAAQTAGFGLGTREAALAAQNAAAQQKAAEEVIRLQAAQQANPQTDPQVYQKQIALAQAQSDRIIALNGQTYDTLTKHQQDWLSGAETAWKNWADSATNVNAEVGNVVTTTFNGLTDSLTTFVTTGKLSFTSLADSIIKDLVRIGVQLAEEKAVSAILGAFGGSSAGAGLGVVNASAGAGEAAGAATAFAASGGFISGPGTGTSDSIPARLSNGEFVVNAQATAANRTLLEHLNGGKGSSGQRHFATGGFVGSTPQSVSGGSTSIVFNIDYGSKNDSGSVGQAGGAGNQKAKAEALQKELEATVISVVRKHSEPGGQINKIIKQVSR